MKKANLYILLMALLLTGLTACKKEGGLNSKELFAYIKTNGGDTRIAQLNLARTPISVTGISETSFVACLTRETTADVAVSVATDESKLAQFNKDNKTEYSLLPASNYKILNGQATIKAGEIVSADSIKIQLQDKDKLTSTKGYMVPLSINQVTSNDAGIQASNTSKTVYLIVKSTYSNINISIKTPVAGTLVNRSTPAWKIVASSTAYSSSYGAANVLDGINTTSWFASGTNTFITVDMANSRAIKGFSLMPSYGFGASYNATGIEVQTSDDNVSWTSQGVYTADPVLSTSSATSPDNRNISFYTAVTCRYVKFILVTVPSGYGGFSEINAYE